PPPREDKPKPKPQPARQVAEAQAKTQVEPAKEAPRPAEVGGDGFADLGGVYLGGGGGATVPGAAAAAAPPPRAVAAAPKATARKVEQLVAAGQGECTEPIVKPKAKTPGQIKYTKEAQEAEIEGVVRVQVTIDETGKVVAAKVLSGLGYGLDERAI